MILTLREFSWLLFLFFFFLCLCVYSSSSSGNTSSRKDETNARDTYVSSFPRAPSTSDSVRLKCREMLAAALRTGGKCCCSVPWPRPPLPCPSRFILWVGPRWSLPLTAQPRERLLCRTLLRAVRRRHPGLCLLRVILRNSRFLPSGECSPESSLFKLFFTILFLLTFNLQTQYLPPSDWELMIHIIVLLLNVTMTYNKFYIHNFISYFFKWERDFGLYMGALI